LPVSEEVVGEKRYRDRQRPFLLLMEQLAERAGGAEKVWKLPEVVRTVFIRDNEDGDGGVILNRVGAV
jgi:hypothetical protein